jgi:hypothetical protein
MTTYEIRVNDHIRATFAADFARAEYPITLDGEPTPYQVGDARHRPDEAAELLIDWCDSEGGPIVEDEEEYEVVRAPEYGFELDGWEGTEDHITADNGEIIEGDYGYSMSTYLDDAWGLLGHAGDCPETFATEAEARKIIAAVRPDDDGVYPRVKVVAVED